MRVTRVLHDAAHVREVQVDESRHIDQRGDALHALAQHIVGRFKSVQQRDLFLADELQALVGDDDEGIHTLQQAGDADLGHVHFALAFKGKGLRDDAHGKNAKLLGHFGHHRRGARARAAAHTGGDEGHLRALEGGGDLVAALLGAALADLGVGARAASLRQLRAKLHLLCGFGGKQRLLIGIHADKFNTAQAALHHAVDSVSAAAAHADDLDVRYILQFFIEDKCHENSP